MSLKVLLADDSMTAQNMGKKILTDAGYQVIAVSNGAQALKKLASEKPDLVVLDVYMPGYTGLEVCERIKNAPDTARIPVVLCVAKMEPFKPEEGTRVRADAVIVKPFEATDLVARVQELCEKVRRQPRPRKVEEQVPEFVEPDIIEPNPHAAHVDVPQELAVEPAVGMELMTEEPAPQVELESSPPSFPESFEIEHERQPVETLTDVRMQSVDGLSGVFEMREPTPSPENAVPEFEIVSQPTTENPSRPDDIRAQAAAAGHVEPLPEFVVDRVSISIPFKQPERLPEPQAPSAPPEPPTATEFAPPAEQPPALPAAPERPDFVDREKLDAATGYTGIYEFEPPRGSLETPAIEMRLGEIRSSDLVEFAEPSISAPQSLSPIMDSGTAVAVETAEPAPEMMSSVPLPVWVAEEVALDQCELNVSLEDEMRAALNASLSAQHVEVPLNIAAERIAAFTTEQSADTGVSEEVIGEIQPAQPHATEASVEPLTGSFAGQDFDGMSDDIIAETTPAPPWESIPDSNSPLPETEAMDALASMQISVPDFVSETPAFAIPGHSFDAVPADEFGPPMGPGMVIEAEVGEDEQSVTEPQSWQITAEVSEPGVYAAEPEPLPTERPAVADHPLGAMAQAIVDSPALTSLKGAEAEPIVEAIVARMLEQIKPELVAHVLRELEKK